MSYRAQNNIDKHAVLFSLYNIPIVTTDGYVFAKDSKLLI